MANSQISGINGNHIHFIGIGGISMSGLAEILLKKGYTVSGSDINDSHIIHKLMEKGAKIQLGHKASHVENADLVVYTAAVKEDNPELMEASRRSIPLMDRAALLGRLMRSFPYSVGVSGTHGKTTTTSMLSVIMNHANLDPTILVGGELDDIGGNVRTGNSSYFITEACEYYDSFLHFSPYIAIILNIDKDHLDFFRDINQIYSSFLKYARLVPHRGYVIGCSDDPLVKKLLGRVHCHTIGYSINGSGDWNARNIKYDSRGCASFRAVYRGQDMGIFSLGIPGIHNVYNALAASAAAWAMGIPQNIIRESLSLYRGTHRRFEIKGRKNNITVIDDYAHHPTEIRATLKAALNYPHRRIWCVFQPHTYTRTKKLFEEFAAAFEDADEIIITDIYAAREKDTGEIHSRQLAEAISDRGLSCRYVSGFEEALEYLDRHALPGDVVLTMGAGNIHRVGERFLGKYVQ